MTELGADWRVIDGVAMAWFAAGSLLEGAALAARILDRTGDALVDLRPSGVRVRVASAEEAHAVSTAARDLGLVADTSVLQRVGVVVESAAPDDVLPFWQQVLSYEATDVGLVDPLRRGPDLTFRASTDARPLRQRIHLDVIRPGAVVEQLGLGPGVGPYGVRHADADGNEVDLVPGDPVGEGDDLADWQQVFAAVACYRTTSAVSQQDLVAAAAAVADGAGFPLLIDVRPGTVLLDSGKDCWERDAHGLDLEFTDVARDLQSAARGAGAVADPAAPRFVQLLLDAADLAAVRAFWVVALGYAQDRRSWTSDIHDDRRLNPSMVFQELDAADTARREQRNRVHVELALPADVVAARVAAMVAAGGRVLDESVGRVRVADPEGNEVVIVSDRGAS